MNQNEPSDPQAILAEVFEFSPADIAANCKGNLSAAQQARMMRKHQADARAARSIFIVIFVIGLLGWSAEAIRTGEMSVRTVLTYCLVMAFLGFIAWGMMLYNRHKLNRTLQQGSAQLVEGKIWLIKKRSGKTHTKHFCVGCHQYQINEYKHWALLEQSGVAGRDATAYVSAPWRSVLSVVLQA
ncbi:MAG: hypothetical protein AAF708_03555 [Deinococcota bacterium]